MMGKYDKFKTDLARFYALEGPIGQVSDHGLRL